MVQLELFPHLSDQAPSKAQTFADIIERISQSDDINTIQKRDLEHALKCVAVGLTVP